MSSPPRERPRLQLKKRDESAVKAAEIERANSGRSVSNHELKQPFQCLAGDQCCLPAIAPLRNELAVFALVAVCSAVAAAACMRQQQQMLETTKQL